MGAEEYLAVILMLPAIDSDLRAEKVENSWLLVSAALIAAMKLIRHGWKALPDSRQLLGCSRGLHNAE